MLGVGDGIPDHVLKEHLEDTTSLFVDETRDSLHTTPPRQSTDGGLSDALDVVTKHFTMTLRATLPQTLSSLATSRHDFKKTIRESQKKQILLIQKEEIHPPVVISRLKLFPPEEAP
jgi:hypothetical protein